jgi:hypothetical protein
VHIGFWRHRRRPRLRVAYLPPTLHEAFGPVHAWIDSMFAAPLSSSRRGATPHPLQSHHWLTTTYWKTVKVCHSISSERVLLRPTIALPPFPQTLRGGSWTFRIASTVERPVTAIPPSATVVTPLGVCCRPNGEPRFLGPSFLSWCRWLASWLWGVACDRSMLVKHI